MTLFPRIGFYRFRMRKMTVRAWFLRRCHFHRSFLFVFVVLCIIVLALVVFFSSILGRRKSSPFEFVVIVGTDSHPSVLRLNRSLISVRRIELSSRVCVDCKIPQADSSVRPVVGVFLLQGESYDDDGFEELLDSNGLIRQGNGVKGPLDIQGIVNQGNNVMKGPPVIQPLIRQDNGVNGPLEIHEPIDKKEEEEQVGDNGEEGEENVQTFIDCQPSFDYAVYVVVRTNGSASKATPSEEGEVVHVTSPWIDRLLSRTTEECRSQGVNVTVWLTTISSETNFVNALSDVLTEAYFDNVIWYDLLIWSDPAQRSHVSLKWAEQPTDVLARRKNVGVVTSGGRRLFIHRRHYEIFGLFFPVKDWTLGTAVRYLLRLYSPRWTSHQPVDGVNGTNRVGSSNGNDIVVGGNGFDGVSDTKSENHDLTEAVATDKHLLERYVKIVVDDPDFDLRRANLLSARVVAMSLYGDDPKYTLGAVRNAQLLPVIFSGWRMFIFCERKVPSGAGEGLASACVSVPPQVTRKLEELGAQMKYIDPSGLAPMMWRFLPIDDVTVDVFISRDSDSRLTERDAAVVSTWLDTDTLFHCIRDHPSHANYAVSGGLWGARTKWLKLVLGQRPISSLVQYSNNYLEDMRFLSSELWPLVQSFAYCHDSVSCDRWPNSHPFPVQRHGAEHVGQVYDAYSRPRQNDVDLLRAAERNSRCEPDRLS